MAEEDPVPPQQGPTLTDLEVARADAAMTHRLTVEWLMSTEEAPDFEVLLAELVNRPAWHRQAACRGAGADVFPERGSGSPKAALAYCKTCSVRSECLASGLAVASTGGVWGGTTGRERRGLRQSVA